LSRRTHPALHRQMGEKGIHLGIHRAARIVASLQFLPVTLDQPGRAWGIRRGVRVGPRAS
jgi:hypothetical protein